MANQYEQHEADARYVSQLRGEVGELKEKMAALERELQATQERHMYWYSLANKFRLECGELKTACRALASLVATWREEAQPAPQEVA